jgi:hypothetical protein
MINVIALIAPNSKNPSLKGDYTMTTTNPQFKLLHAADAAIYGIDIADGCKANIGSMNPFRARKAQQNLMDSKKFTWALCLPPIGKPFCVRISRRQLEVLSKIQDGRWWHSSQLKSLQSDTRKPISELRQVGFIIVSKGKPSEYQLLGRVELNPSLSDRVNNPDVLTILLSIDESEQIERARAKDRIAKTMFNINKDAELMRAFSEVA